ECLLCRLAPSTCGLPTGPAPTSRRRKRIKTSSSSRCRTAPSSRSWSTTSSGRLSTQWRSRSSSKGMPSTRRTTWAAAAICSSPALPRQRPMP
ncbi:unnamed protein product, partial [Symbiodinium sp. KB8]